MGREKVKTFRRTHTHTHTHTHSLSVSPLPSSLPSPASDAHEHAPPLPLPNPSSRAGRSEAGERGAKEARLGLGCAFSSSSPLLSPRAPHSGTTRAVYSAAPSAAVLCAERTASAASRGPRERPSAQRGDKGRHWKSYDIYELLHTHIKKRRKQAQCATKRINENKTPRRENKTPRRETTSEPKPQAHRRPSTEPRCSQ